MSNSIFRAFLTSFGNSFDFATNFNLYRFFSSLVKSLTKITKKRYRAQWDSPKYRYTVALCPPESCLAPTKRENYNTYLER